MYYEDYLQNLATEALSPWIMCKRSIRFLHPFGVVYKHNVSFNYL